MLKSRLTDCEFDSVLRNLLVEESGRPVAKPSGDLPRSNSQAKDTSGAYTSPSGAQRMHLMLPVDFREAM